MIIKALETKKLSIKDINSICTLKDTHWKFGIKSQLNFFKNSYRPNDIHICIYSNNNLVGYNCLRKRKIIISDFNSIYILFDSLIVSSKYRNKKLSTYLINFSNTYIYSQKLIGVLLCNNDLLSFYGRHNWIKINRRNNNIINIPLEKNIMTYNSNVLGSKNNFKKKDIQIFL